eukprot:scaffold27374_cov112-Isochrysis_galbana.AAC.1
MAPHTTAAPASAGGSWRMAQMDTGDWSSRLALGNRRRGSVSRALAAPTTRKGNGKPPYSNSRPPRGGPSIDPSPRAASAQPRD